MKMNSHLTWDRNTGWWSWKARGIFLHTYIYGIAICLLVVRRHLTNLSLLQLPVRVGTKANSSLHPLFSIIFFVPLTCIVAKEGISQCMPLCPTTTDQMMPFFVHFWGYPYSLHFSLFSYLVDSLKWIPGCSAMSVPLTVCCLFYL